MLRILKYLKPFIPLLVLAVILLFIQANADLALPDYMSRIVNVGIQQGGVEGAAPEALRASTLEHLSLFLTESQKADVLAHYRRLDPSSADAQAYVQRYPALTNEPVYILQTDEAATLERLGSLLARPLLIVNGIEQVNADPSLASQLMPGISNFDLSNLPPGVDLFTMIARLPEAQRDQISQAIDQRFAPLGGDKAIAQAAARAVKAEYEALGMDMAQIQSAYIFKVGGQMLLITLVSVIATVSVGFLAARTAAGLARDLRRVFFEKVMHFSAAELDRFSTASLITRSTNDITQIQMVLMITVRMLFYAPIIGVGGILRALSKSASMWWIIALAVLVLLGLIVTVFSVAVPKFRIIQSLIDRLNLVARENLSGMMVVRAFNRQEHEEERFDQANLDLTQTSLFVNRVFVIMMPLMLLLMNGVSILIIWVGAHQVAQANMQVGDMMAFMQYAIQIVFAFMMFSALFIMIPRAAVAANRVADVLETEPVIIDPQQPQSFPEPFKGDIEFRGVSFRYPDAEKDVLHDLNFTIRAGQTVGIIGTTGSGKSSVINLIPRFHDVTEGAIYIDGIDIRSARLSELRDKIGYIPQQSNLFSGTIESNLRYADEDADEDSMRQALEIAQGSDFVFSRLEGLAAEVSQGGTNFSGGQKQRLSIARALVKRPPIYIFDDSFSALDHRTDSRLRQALKKYVAGSTMIIVSQRVASIKDADQILVLDEGRIIGRGTHEELMRTCETYQEIALSQLKKQAVLA
jgi:ATP-binding cassette subfamily B protein